MNATILTYPSPATLVSQNFESGLGGWTTTNTSTGGIPANADWTIRTSSYTYSEILNSGSKFIMSNSDAAGGANSGTTTLVSPAFSAVGYTAMSLTFKQRYRYNGSESQNIDISINGGAWTNLYSNSASAGQTNFSTTYSLSLDAYAGLSNLKLRFRYVFSFDWYWCIDDITITGTAPTTTYAWTPTTGLSNAVISNPIATPTTTTTYTVTASNGTCQSTDNITVYVSGETTPSGTLATTTSSFTCAVNDAAWHYFRNSDGELIAAINGNGQTLGNVTLKVDVDANPNVHPNGGMGHAAMCNGTNELSVRRWYTVTTANTPTATTNLKFFFTPADYSNYTTVVDAVIASSAPYTACYGSTASVGDLRLSRNETNDVSTFAVSTTNLNGFAVTPANSVEYELALSPANMRLINGASPNIITAGPTTFRWHTDGGIGAPLPVELVSFTGYNNKDQNVLNWTTASEKNSDKFEVEKSTDGVSWISIGWQKAVGGNTLTNYTFYDNQPIVGNNYYRLKIIDNDRTFTYSNTINISVNAAMVNGFVKIFPNPTNGLVTIQLQSTKNAVSILQVTNLLGQVVKSSEIALSTGVTHVSLDMHELPNGTYLVSFVDALGARHLEKIVKQ